MFPLHSSLKRAGLCLVVAAPVLLTTPAHADYTINADGTVTDTTTGLVWDQCVLGSRASAATSCIANTNSIYTWADALAQVSARNTAKHLGYNDWRLPNISELESLVDTTAATAPTVNTSAFPSMPITGDSLGRGGNWSSTSFETNLTATTAWVVAFNYGTSFNYNKGDSNFVRLVRSGQSFSGFDGGVTTSYTAPTPSGSTTSGNVTTTLSGGGAVSCAMGSVAYKSASSVGAAPPAGVLFPAGVVNFTTTGCAVGGTVTITLTYPSPLPAGTQLYKYGPATAGASPSWYVHPATISGNTITYSVTDNGVGDSNNAAGVITDPAGAGVSGGVSGVPTLSQWALMLLAGLVGLAAVWPRACAKGWSHR